MSRASRAVMMWFRSDLRARDNPALCLAAAEAARRGAPLVGLFVVSPEEWRDHGAGLPKVSFVLRSAAALRSALADGPGVPLLVRVAEDLGPGRAQHTVAAARAAARAAADLGADAVFLNHEYGANEGARDAAFRREAAGAGVAVTAVHDQCVVPPGTLVAAASGKPYRVFSPYFKRWLALVGGSRGADGLLALRPAPAKLECRAEAEALAAEAASDPLPQSPLGVRGYGGGDGDGGGDDGEAKALLAAVRSSFPAGEAAAHERLAEFASRRARDYDAARDALGQASGTSRLSPYLAAGVLSGRQCVVAAAAANRGRLEGGSAGCARWISELAWRDFYRTVMHEFPQVARGEPFVDFTRRVEWRHDEEELRRWREGRTGYPVVDAGMRELRRTGFMHNRARMICAMFLTKHLLVHWQHGERHFARYLADLDYPSNNGGWQWSASSGVDAQPYFRIFSPMRQAERFDPRGDYIRRWVPELASLPDKHLCAPWEHLDAEALERLGYCAPVVDHREARARCLAVFKAARLAEPKRAAPPEAPRAVRQPRKRRRL